jgi:hypothetical protein
MSHYTRCKTQIKDKSCLVQALDDLGFKNKLKVHDKAQQLEGFQGDKREQTAEVVIPRRYVGGASNDIGFKEQKDGTYEAIISGYDKSRYNTDWLKKLGKRYARHKVMKEVADQGFTVESEEIDENGEIHIEVSALGWGG